MGKSVRAWAATTSVFWLVSSAAGQAQDLGLRVASQVDGLEVVRLDRLPNAPKDNGDRNFCSNLIIDAASAAGRDVEKQGWAVTGEVPLGEFQAVSFVGKFEAGTSGTCALSDGNVGIFHGRQLVAIAYAGKNSSISIGKVISFGTNGVRIFNGELLEMTVADMRLAGTSGLVVTPPALQEKVCDGSATVPFIERLPIDIARDMLAENGWNPVDLTNANTRSAGQAQSIAKLGIVEVEDCSGTGFGYCRYDYRNTAGDLSVTTAGEVISNGTLPWVVGYGVNCSPTKG